MRKITEVALPGVGVRQEFTTGHGQRVAVVSQRDGRREVALYQREDPDTYRAVLELDGEDAATLASILGAPEVASTAAEMQRIEGLAIDWVTVAKGSPADGATLGAGQYRTLTGSSIVAVLRGDRTHPAPGPDFLFAAGDVLVSVGTPSGLKQLRSLLGA